ncbi:MAG: hypothetical protein VYA71_08175 [Pseudomonadota bacterium]|nr:hypothetical protein [Pseudomonadota bacterium]
MVFGETPAAHAVVNGTLLLSGVGPERDVADFRDYGIEGLGNNKTRQDNRTVDSQLSREVSDQVAAGWSIQVMERIVVEVDEAVEGVHDGH